jgi:hypothetical protein
MRFTTPILRKRAKGQVADLADALKRVQHLKEELPAWKALLDMPGVATLECLG